MVNDKNDNDTNKPNVNRPHDMAQTVFSVSLYLVHTSY